MENASARNITVDSVITERKALLVAAHLTATAAGAATATFYNGVDINGTKIVTLSAPASEFAQFSPHAPIFCEQGIYIDVGSNAEGVCVVWSYAE